MPQLPLRMVTGDMDRVERLLRSSVQTDSRRLTEIVAHLLEAGGKRLRPLLTLCAAYSVQTDGADRAVDGRVVTAAAAVELMHLGSLYHDDVIDEAEVRRGVASVNARWGNTKAVLSGDFLLAKSSSLGASLGAQEAEIVADALSDLCIGQMRESFTLFDPERDEHDYRACIEGKTAVLMEAACRLGGLEAGGSPESVEALAHFGRELGVAFQIIDDVRDLEDEAIAPGCDLAEGVYTLPVIRARAGVPEVADLLGTGADRAALARVRRIVHDCGAIEASVQAAADHLARARAIMAGARGLHAEVSFQLLDLADRVVALGGAERDDRPVMISGVGG